MQELSLNILDIAQNSVKAEASLIEIELCQNTTEKTLLLCIKDNGKGMSKELAEKVTDPFCTSRTTRKVGLGLPFLKMAAQLAGGDMQIESQVGKGTIVRASFVLGHIDLAPIGDMGSTMSALVQCNPDIDFVFAFTSDNNSFEFDTKEAREMLDGVPLSTPEVAIFVRDYIAQNMQAVLLQNKQIKE